MNKSFEEQLLEEIRKEFGDNQTPIHNVRMPRIFRLTTINQTPDNERRTQCTATLYHSSRTLKVSWTVRSPDLRLKVGDLVSPCWFANKTNEGGAIKISRLMLMERPEPWENLFCTIPPDWVEDRELIALGAELIEGLPRAYRYLFNAIFWDGQRFKRFCTMPSSINGHHSVDGGNLRHSVDVAQGIRQLCQDREMSNESLGILVGLLHDAGKAEDYCLEANGEWKLTDRGNLLGHRITVIEWVAEAKAKWNLQMPDEHHMALLHCLTCSPSTTEWMGSKKSLMLEAILLSNMDRLSDTENLIRRCSSGKPGWGAYHSHLNGRPYRISNSLAR